MTITTDDGNFKYYNLNSNPSVDIIPTVNAIKIAVAINSVPEEATELTLKLSIIGCFKSGELFIFYDQLQISLSFFRLFAHILDYIV